MAEWKIEEWRGKEVHDKATDASVAIMERAALMVERDVKLSFTRKGAGRVYGKHTASRAGEPPAIDTGTLRASIGHEVIKASGYVDGLVGDTNNVKYAPMLELGTSKMAPRPFLRPALKRLRNQIADMFKGS